MDISTETRRNCSDNIIQSMGKVEDTHDGKLSKSSSGVSRLSDSTGVAVQSPFELQSRPVEGNRYGWGCFTPAILQPLLNNAKAFLIFVTISNVIHGIIVNGLVKVRCSTLINSYCLPAILAFFDVMCYFLSGQCHIYRATLPIIELRIRHHNQ